MGIANLTGYEVPEDLDEARTWLQRAAEQGQPGAAEILAGMPETRSPQK
jgi:TPR repeat protein